MKEVEGICKKCLGCNKLEDENFKGVQKCKFCTLEQIILEQVKIDLDREKANEVRDTNI